MGLISPMNDKSLPSWRQWDTKKTLITSLIVFRVRDRDLWNASKWFKDPARLCKHTDGLMFKTNIIEIDSDVRSKPLGQKRKRGRPKKLPSCLARSPEQPVRSILTAVTSPDVSLLRSTIWLVSLSVLRIRRQSCLLFPSCRLKKIK